MYVSKFGRGFKINKTTQYKHSLSKLKSDVRQIKQAIEYKTHDVANAASRTGTGSIIPLSQIVQGESSLTRNGLQICPSHIEFKLVTVADTTLSQFVRVIFFVDKQNHGTYPTISELLESDSVFAFPEHNTKPRFKILKDKVYNISVVGRPNTFAKGVIKFPKNFKIWYNGSSASEASNGLNALFAYIVSNDSINPPSGHLYTRLRYKDL